jgi:isopenicillin-N N-acyltransferase-like protein
LKKSEMSKPWYRRRILKWLAGIVIALAILAVLFRLAVTIRPPEVVPAQAGYLERSSPGPDMYECGDSWLKKNPYGVWEMYLRGGDFEMGVKNGILAEELIRFQEEVFVEKLREMVPSESYLRFLKYVVVWMNRNLDKYIPVEYQREIYGVSLKASHEYDFIGPAYQRILNYHAAHDIGHALQNMNLVACTAMGVKGERSADGELLVGRNFDFSMGDEFARNKIVTFVDPDQGYRFAYITWGGMIGVVSGMNTMGLVVTLNAAKSGIPGSAKTPTSILARQILQYASSIEEAYALAGQCETFVSESFLISSTKDDKTVVIEKSPGGVALYDPGGDELILTNHFQSETFKNSKLTLRNLAEGASLYRWERTRELMDREEQHDVFSFVRILRDQNGAGDLPIGMGNEKAVNQLIAHHSVVFKPKALKMWVSTSPYQLGDYLCYDLNRVFSDSTGIRNEVFNRGETVGQDPFLSSEEYQNFIVYKRQTEELKELLHQKHPDLTGDSFIRDYLKLNPHYYYPYFLAGEFYRLAGNAPLAEMMYKEALSREIPRKVDREQVIEARKRLTK